MSGLDALRRAECAIGAGVMTDSDASTPFDSLQDLADELLRRFADEVASALRNARSRATTDAIWRSLAGIDITDAQIERGILEFNRVPAVPGEEVTRWRRKARFFALEAPAKRAAFAAQLGALDDTRLRNALRAAVDAQAASCLAGNARGWLETDAANRAARALAARVALPDWRAGRERLAEVVRERILEIVTAGWAVAA